MIWGGSPHFWFNTHFDFRKLLQNRSAAEKRWISPYRAPSNNTRLPAPRRSAGSNPKVPRDPSTQTAGGKQSGDRQGCGPPIPTYPGHGKSLYILRGYLWVIPKNPQLSLEATLSDFKQPQELSLHHFHHDHHHHPHQHMRTHMSPPVKHLHRHRHPTTPPHPHPEVDILVFHYFTVVSGYMCSYFIGIINRIAKV